jgi:hypothetical protein
MAVSTAKSALVLGDYGSPQPCNHQTGALFAMKGTSWDRALEVTADGNGLVGHAGGILLRKLADQVGLTAELDAALTQRGASPQVSRGVTLASTAIAIAMGATSMADVEVLGQLSPVSRSETRPRVVSWGFAAGSGVWLGSSRGAAVDRLPLGEVPVRPAGCPGPV